MRAALPASVLVLVSVGWITEVHAHNVERVRRELQQQGFDQLEFSRTKPPFKLDACHGGERFHLHVDYYGKIIEQTSIGSCDDEASSGTPAAPSSQGSAATGAASGKVEAENSTITPAHPSKPSTTVDRTPKAPAQELCARYSPATGQTLQVACD